MYDHLYPFKLILVLAQFSNYFLKMNPLEKKTGKHFIKQQMCYHHPGLTQNTQISL